MSLHSSFYTLCGHVKKQLKNLEQLIIVLYFLSFYRFIVTSLRSVPSFHRAPPPGVLVYLLMA